MNTCRCPFRNFREPRHSTRCVGRPAKQASRMSGKPQKSCNNPTPGPRRHLIFRCQNGKSGAAFCCEPESVILVHFLSGWVRVAISEVLLFFKWQVIIHRDGSYAGVLSARESAPSSWEMIATPVCISAARRECSALALKPSVAPLVANGNSRLQQTFSDVPRPPVRTALHASFFRARA
jgi:hypothetical protein